MRAGVVHFRATPQRLILIYDINHRHLKGLDCTLLRPNTAILFAAVYFRRTCLSSNSESY
jgi:hypothetical protein